MVNSFSGYGSVINLNPHVINGSFGYFDRTAAGNPMPGIGGVPYPARAREFDDLTWDSRGLFVAAAGNAGPRSTELNPIARGPNTIAVGNYQDGGAINPNSLFLEFLGYQKPELSAIGTNINVEGLTNQTGTSFSAPHVSGVIGALTGQYPGLRFRPALLKSLVISGAVRPVTGGTGIASNGYGGIDASSFHAGTTRTHASFGMRGTWSLIETFADGQANNIARYTMNIPQATGNARAVLSVMKNPDSIWANRNATRPLGTDVNFSVFGPAGQYIGGSYSWIDPVEVLDFALVGAGQYRVEVQRPWERDGGQIEIGVTVNWDL